ncbi:MAG: glycosyltransferase, partial [Nitrososphaera sp.]|nr:glycosyltransferase [Nitrososphaera sp.]
QTYRHTEIIVVDDGSTDDTVRQLSPFLQRGITLLRQDNRGVAAARNAALRVSSGQYIAFLDADDTWDDEKVEKQVNYLSSHDDITVLYTDAEQFEEGSGFRDSYVAQHPGVRDPATLMRAMTRFDIPLTSTLMIRADFLRRHEIAFIEEVNVGEDLGLLIEIHARGGRFALLDKKLARRRLHASNISKVHLNRFEKRIVLYRDLLRRYNGMPWTWKRHLYWGLSDAYFRVGEWHWGNGSIVTARKYFLRGVDIGQPGLKAFVYFVCSFLPQRLLSAIRSHKRRIASKRALQGRHTI